MFPSNFLSNTPHFTWTLSAPDLKPIALGTFQPHLGAHISKIDAADTIALLTGCRRNAVCNGQLVARIDGYEASACCIRERLSMQCQWALEICYKKFHRRFHQSVPYSFPKFQSTVLEFRKQSVDEMLLRNAIKVSGYVDLLQHLALKLRYSPVLLTNCHSFCFQRASFHPPARSSKF